MFKVDKTIKKLIIFIYCILMLFTPGNAGPEGRFELIEVRPRLFTPEEEDSRINTVRFSFSETYEEVTIRIFNIMGMEIRKNLVRVSDNENVMLWDGKDENSNIVPAGIYLYQVEAEGELITGAIIVVK